MNKSTLMAAALLIVSGGTIQAQNTVNIGKNNITLQSDLMTPEALWAMGRIGEHQPHPMERK